MANHSFDFPQSKYGIEYRLDMKHEKFKDKRRNPGIRSSKFFWKGKQKKLKKKKNQSPFEHFVEKLEHVISKNKYPIGSAIIYLREIFEPADEGFELRVICGVNASQLTQEHIDRLRLMILPRRREEILVEYLEYFSKRPRFPEISKQWGIFRHRYSKLGSAKDKFDLLFGFCFALRTYPEWTQHQCKTSQGRERMILALARHWRNLIENHLPASLGLDEAFSYPAMRYFLYDFKMEIERADILGGEPLTFILGKEIIVPHDDICEASVSTMTKSVHSRPSL